MTVHTALLFYQTTKFRNDSKLVNKELPHYFNILHCVMYHNSLSPHSPLRMDLFRLWYREGHELDLGELALGRQGSAPLESSPGLGLSLLFFFFERSLRGNFVSSGLLGALPLFLVNEV